MARRTAALPLRDRIGSITSGTLAWIYAALLIVPFYYFIVSSFKDNEQIFESPLALPTTWDLSNFSTAIQQAELGLAIANSALTTLAALALTLLLALPA
ncbi:MAG: carbohydrate ABC transporter permease, partial [Pseudonocardia sp.]